MTARSFWQSISALFHKAAASHSLRTDAPDSSASGAPQQYDLNDLPFPFGYKMEWIAVRQQDAHVVAESLGLQSIEPSGWLSGFQRAYDGRGIFVTPAVLGWTMALGALPEAGNPDFLPFMESVSEKFHQAFYFGSHRIVDYYAWVVAEKGIIRRAYAWLESSVCLNIGERMAEEVELGAGLEDFEHAPDEEAVLDLASRWVLDPRDLDKHPEARGPGCFGTNERGLHMEQFLKQLKR